MTVNSLKYWRHEVLEKTSIEFKFHGLRRTHLTMLAEMGTPPIELMKRAGHKKFSTTMKFYINDDASTHKIIQQNINKLTLEEKLIEVTTDKGVIQVPEHLIMMYSHTTAKIPH